MTYKPSEKKTDRVQFDVEYLKFINDLVKSTGTGPFSTRANVLGFAAAYCLHNGGTPTKISTRITTKLGADPIRLEVLGNKDTNLMEFIYMLAFIATDDPKILDNTYEKEYERLSVFEEFANTGLNMLRNKLRGSVDYTKDILILIKSTSSEKEAEFGQIPEELLDF